METPTRHRCLPFTRFLLYVTFFYSSIGLALPAGLADEPLATPTNPVLENEVLRLSAVGRANVEKITSAYLRYRATGTDRNLKAYLTPQECEQTLNQIDFDKEADPLRVFVQAISEDADSVHEQPWTEIEITSDGGKLRTTRTWTEEKDIHLTNETLSIRWDHANYQLNIQPVSENRYHQPSIREFLRASPIQNIDRDRPSELVDLGSTIRMADGNENSRIELQIDKSSGMIARETRFQKDKGLVSDRFWLKWHLDSSGVSFPKVTAEFEFVENILARYDVRVVSEITLNQPISKSVFTVGAPVGSHIFSEVPQIPGGTVNRELADVTSPELVSDATKPYGRTLLPDEVAGVEEARRVYALDAGQIVKRISPPFPEARSHVHRMMGAQYAQRPGEFSRLMTFDGDNFEHEFMHTNGTFNVASIIQRLTRLRSVEIEGDRELLKLPLAGDIVFRKDADKDAVAESLGKLLTAATGKNVTLEFREVDRPVYIASGKLQPNLPAGQTQIGMNGGPHTGDFGEMIDSGTLDKFIRSLSAYIKIRVVDETENSPERFEWSERWYDLTTTETAKRMDVKAEEVIDYVAVQTGLSFRHEVRAVRVLFAEYR